MGKIGRVPELRRSGPTATWARDPTAPAGLGLDEVSSSPHVKSVLAKLAEYRTIGEALFLNRYASGRRPKAHYFVYEGRHYPVKAVWAAAHKPPTHTRTFRTSEALAGLAALGFLVELAPSHRHQTTSEIDKQADKFESDGDAS
jgi:hypothetical protein